jgi:protein TonB
MIKEDDLPPVANAGGVGGVPGGVPGGAPGGVIGGIIGSVPSAAPPPPPVKEPPKPATPKSIRVGGNVQSAKLIRQPKPAYPPLAKQARIQGTVRFNAVIGRDGTIQNLTLASGHPLLVPAATEAVRQWVYQPTLLNGEPVEVVTQIDVNFTLSQ